MRTLQLGYYSHAYFWLLGKEGGWNPVYQQEMGISTVRKTSLPETRLVSRFYLAIAAPPVSHHLNQLYASKFIQSLPVC